MNLTDLLSSVGGGEALSQAANQAAGAAGVEPGQAHGAMQEIIEHMAAGGAESEMVEVVASKCGLSPDQVQAILPHVMPLLQSHAEGATGETQGLLGGLIGRLGGLLGGAERQ
jgi:hypothetical protein